MSPSSRSIGFGSSDAFVCLGSTTASSSEPSVSTLVQRKQRCRALDEMRFLNYWTAWTRRWRIDTTNRRTLMMDDSTVTLDFSRAHVFEAGSKGHLRHRNAVAAATGPAFCAGLHTFCKAPAAFGMYRLLRPGVTECMHILGVIHARDV